MSIFDSLKRGAANALKKEAVKATNQAVQNVGKGRNHSETFTFSALPQNLGQLQALPEASLDTAYKATALTILALCRYEHSPEDAI